MSNSASQSSSYIPEKMATKPPVEIGSKGTIGSLIMQEIEYFNRPAVHSHKHSLKLPEAAQTSTGSRRKNKFIPSICSAIEVESINGPKMISGLKVTRTRKDS